jgi:hypothetical protein
MKKTILGMMVCLGGWMGTASAQMVGHINMTLPYAASVGGVTLPAGEYTVRDLQDNGSTLLQISAFDGKSVFVLAIQVVAPKGRPVSNAPVVELKHTDAGYEVDTIWLGGQENGFRLVTK